MNGISNKISNISASHNLHISTSSTHSKKENRISSITDNSSKKQQSINKFLESRPSAIPPKQPKNPYLSQQPHDDEKITFQHRLSPHQEKDFQWLGVKIYPKLNNVFRIWSQNLNGIDYSNNMAMFSECLHSLSGYEIQHFGFTETNLNTSNAYVRDTLEHLTQQVFPASRHSMSSTKTDQITEPRQFGGTLSLAVGPLAARVACCGSDAYGRFSWIQFFGKKYHLRIYTVYNPVPHTDSSKHDSAVWVQQRTALLQDNIIENPNEHLLQTLSDMIVDDVKQDRQVIVMGDMNCNIFDTKLNSIFEKCGLVNIVSTYIDTATTSRSWFRGRRIIDGFWGTPFVQSNVHALGYAPFSFVIPSDHRGMYVDVNTINILDDNEAKLTPLPYRRLKTSIPKRVQKYSDAVAEGWFLYNMSEKIQHMADLLRISGVNDENVTKLNKLDNEVSAILRTSEIKCCNVGRQDTSFYSSHLAKAIKQERLLKGRLRRESMRQSFKRSTPVLVKILKELKQVRREKRDAKRHDVSLREKHLDECAEQYLRDHPGCEKDNVVRQLKHIEKQKREAVRIRIALKGRFEGGLNYVLVPSESAYSEEERSNEDFNVLNMEYIWPRVQIANGKDITEWNIVNDKETVEALTLACMRKHFGQAQGTPLTSDFWIKTLTNKDSQNAIMEGSFDLTPYPRSLQLYFKAMQRIHEKDEIPFDYNFSQFCKFVSKSNERTSTSPSGRHYGHYKVLLQRQKGILEDIYMIMHMAFSNGILLDRYKVTVTTLIAKDKGKPRIHRLRPIHIIEAELQALSKSQWAQSLITRAEANNDIVHSQYGGRHGKQAQSAVLNKVLIFDITRHLAKPMISVDEDLKANYDRELAHLGALEDRFVGLSHEHGTYLVKTTREQQFFVKTGFGISTENYSYTDTDKIWGLGQGIGWAGARWLVTSSLIDKIMTDQCSGILFESPDKNTCINKITDMFVDDLNQYCNNPTHGRTIVTQAQHNVQLHSDLAYCTGGCIALDKCKFFHVDFYFDEYGQSHLFSKDDLPTSLLINSAIDGVPVEIEQLDVNDPWRSLGYFINPTGSQSQLFKCVEGYVDEWCNRIRTSKLFPNEIILSYFTVLVPQVTYRLAASSFTFEQCDKLMKKVYPIILNAYGFHRHFSRTMASAPFQYGGLNIQHFFDIQGQQKIKFFTMHLKRGDTTGKLIDIALQHMQLSIGTTNHFFHHEYDCYQHLLPHSWLKQLLQYLDSRRITIDVTRPQTLLPQRMNDRTIMEVLSPYFTQHEMILVNRMRIHLKLFHISDMVDISGKKVLGNIIHHTNYRASHWEWPTQPLPSNAKKLWIQACRKISQYVATHRLGRWVRTNQTWNWKLSNDSNFLRGPDKSLYHLVKKRYGSSYEKIHDNGAVCDVDADISTDRNRIAVLSSSVLVTNNQTMLQCPYQSFFESHILPYRVEKKIVRLLKKGRLLYGSDATFKDGCGAFAWGVYDKSNPKAALIKYHAPLHGNEHQNHSTRGELFGLFGCMRHIHYLQEKYKFSARTKIPIYIYTDSASSISIIKKKFHLSSTTCVENDSDIKTEVRTVYKKIRKFVEVSHVKSHQDDKVRYEHLSHASKMNILMDHYAAAALLKKTKIKHKNVIPHLPEQAGSIVQISI